MSEHVERLKQVANLLDETQNGMAAVGVDKAVEYLTSLEQRAAELEQALRGSAMLLHYIKADIRCDALDRDVTYGNCKTQIAANERLMRGENDDGR